jgi:hypothetical protein
MEKFGCVYCDHEISLEEYRFFVSISKFKKLSKLDLERKFAMEIPLLKETAKLIEMEKRYRTVELLVNWMRMDGISEENIFKNLSDSGLLDLHHSVANDEMNESIVNSCPDCGNLLKENFSFKQCVNCKTLACKNCISKISSLEEPHSCDLTRLKEMETNFQNWRPCPECRVLIEKSSGGCDQMFCVLCKTTFSWRTGRRASKEEVKHNPHFYQWQRQQTPNERNPLDNPCEGHFLIKCQEMEKSTDSGDDLGSYLKLVQAMMMNSLESFVRVREMDEFIRQQFRTLYLTKKYSERKWKVKFSQQLETLKRNSEMQKLLSIALDSMYQIVLEKERDEAEDLFLTKLEILFDFVSKHLQAIQKRFGKTKEYSIETINAGVINLPYQHQRVEI